MSKLRVAPPPAPAEATTPPPPRLDIFDWGLMDEQDPRTLARALLAATTLAHLTVEGVNRGGDATGIPNDAVADKLLHDLMTFSNHLADVLVDRLEDQAAS